MPRDRIRLRLRSLLNRAEAHPVATVLVVAFAARLVVAVGIYLQRGGIGFQDDATYWALAGQAANGMDSRWDAYTHWLYDYTATFLVPLTWVYKLSDGFRLAGQVFSAVCGALTAGLVCRLAAEVTTRGFAVVAGLVVALMPSEVLWSSLTLKDATVWVCVAAMALVVALLARQIQLLRFAALLGTAAGLLYLIDHLRIATFIVATWAFALATWFGPAPRRMLRGLSATGVAIVLPWALGVGIAGLSYVENGESSLQARRINNAVGAATAVVPTPAPTPSSIQTKPPSPSKQPSGRPSPPSTPSPTLPTLSDGASEQLTTNVRYLPHGLSVILLRPWPWSGTGGSGSVRAALAENVIWWPLLILAGVGAFAIRRNAAALAFPLLVGVATAVTYGLAEGNFGTAYRHRGELVWIVALFAALGAQLIVRRITLRRRTGASGESGGWQTVPDGAEPVDRGSHAFLERDSSRVREQRS